MISTKLNLGRAAIALIVAGSPAAALAVDVSTLGGATSILLASGVEETPESNRPATEAGQWPGSADRAPEATPMAEQKATGMKVGENIDDARVFAPANEGIPVVSDQTFQNTGYIAETFEPFAEVIDGTYSAQNLFSAPEDVIYLSKGEKDGVKVGDQFAIVHTGNAMTDPETGDTLGVIVYLDGIVKVTDTADDTAEAVITQSYDSIERGDIVVRHENRRVPTIDPDAPLTDKKITGRIVVGYGTQNEYASGDVIFLNVGAAQGVAAGDVFDIKGEDKVTRRDGTVVDGLPKYRAQAQVFDTRSRTSSALIIHSISSVTRGNLAVYSLER